MGLRSEPQASSQSLGFIKPIALSCFMLFMMLGCGGDYSGLSEISEETGDTSGQVDSGTDDCEVQVETTTELSAELLEGQSIYQNQCQVCHGAQGLGTSSGSSLVGCPTCGDFSVLSQHIVNTMPIGNETSCAGECADQAAQYIQDVFNSTDSKPTTVVDCSPPEASLLAAVQPEPLSKTLYRASLSLTGELPEQSMAEAENLSEADLDKAIDALFEQPSFYKRLMEIYNDQLLQDKYLPGEDAIVLLDREDYPSYRWYNDLGLNNDIREERELLSWLRNTSNDAVSEEALRLIAYVVKNDRPFTEILTADYMVTNYYSARVYGIEAAKNDDETDENPGEYAATETISWRTLEDPYHPDYPQDPEDFQAVRLPDIPHAGLLTSAMFLNRFPTTDTNLNRHRAAILYDYFLDTDILGLPGSRPNDSSDLLSDTPTLDNPACTGCHNIMDPVASAFQNWDDEGRFRPSRLDNSWPTDILPRGFNGLVMPLAGNVDSSLRWLAQQVVKDPRFARATVKILYTGLLGDRPLAAPTATASEAEQTAYLTQRQYLAGVEQAFINANYNLKVAIKGLLLSPYYRAAGGGAELNPSLGNARLLTPEMLDRKIFAVTGFAWQNSFNSSRTYLDKEAGDFNQVYGGIDSDNVTRRITQVNGLMASVQNLIASEMACQITTKDFFYSPEQRRLFPYVALDVAPWNEDGQPISPNIEAIRANIQHLHWRLFGEAPGSNTTEIDLSYQLFVELLKAGQEKIDKQSISNRLPYYCDLDRHPETNESLPNEQRIYEDRQYIIRAWQGLLTYMLADYRFVYE